MSRSKPNPFLKSGCKSLREYKNALELLFFTSLDSFSPTGMEQAFAERLLNTVKKVGRLSLRCVAGVKKTSDLNQCSLFFCS